MIARVLSRSALLGALLLLLCGALRADTIRFKNGQRLQGQATAYDEQTRLLSFQVEGGELRQIPVDELDGRHLYQVVRSQVPKDDGPKQLKLATFAREVGLYAHSARHYRQALAADPSLREEIERELALLRREAGSWAMGKVRDAVAEKDYKTAERWLTKIVRKLPGEPVAREAAAMLERYHEQVHAAKDDALEAKHAALLEKDLKQAKQHYDRMLAKNREGLTNEGSGNKSVKAWEAALVAGEKAQRELNRFEKKHDEPGMAEAIAGYRKLVDEHRIEIHLNLASHRTSRSSYNAALAQVNKALAIDPKNAQALSMRARIEDASSRGLEWGWGWGWRIGAGDRLR